jgi:23S rRNA (uridine2552-2'-O)-methyltransferase
MAYNPRDHYFKLAKKKNFVARSVFKLEEIDQRFRLFHAGQTVLDLGAAPGSWTQYALQRVGPNGFVLAIDLQPIRLTDPRLVVVQGDAGDSQWLRHLNERSRAQVDVVLSDMAPRTTGIKFTDQTRSLELCQMALGVARERLKTGGSFACKLFHSESFSDFKKDMESSFGRVAVLRPDSTRKSSREIFLIGLQLRGR